MRAVIDLSFDAARHVTSELGAVASADVPLQVYARYQREEILAALDYATGSQAQLSFREGVLYSPS